MATTKRCTKCGREQGVGNFYRHPTSSGGLSYICKDCCRLKHKLAYKPRQNSYINQGRERADLLAKGLRRCNTCKQVKSLDDFGKTKMQYPGDRYSYYCLECGRRCSREGRKRKQQIINKSPAGLFRRERAEKLKQGLKYCPKCKLFRPLGDYNKSKKSPNGLNVYCKICLRYMGRSWQKVFDKHKEKLAFSWSIYTATVRLSAAQEKVREKRLFLLGCHNQKCVKCGKIKDLDEFGNIKGKKRGSCKQCEREWYRQHSQTPEEKQKTKEGSAAYHQRPEVKQRRREYRRLPQAKKAKNLYRQRRRKRDPAYALINRMDKAVRRALKRRKYDGRPVRIGPNLKYLDYTGDELAKHLISTLPDGYKLPWDLGKLHIDHIIPKSAFKYKTPDDRAFKKCWSLSNLRLISRGSNIKKGDRMPFRFGEELVID